MMGSTSTGTPRQSFVTFEKLKSQLASHYQQLKVEFDDDVDVSLQFRMATFMKQLVLSINSVETAHVHVVSSGSTHTSDALRLVGCKLGKLSDNTVSVAVS